MRACIGSTAPAPNLVLGPTIDHAWLAEGFARTPLPGVDIGYHVEPPAVYDEIMYDDNSFFDRLGGGFYRRAESYRTQIWIR